LLRIRTEIKGSKNNTVLDRSSHTTNYSS
jgi:hypothetical protein